MSDGRLTLPTHERGGENNGGGPHVVAAAPNHIFIRSRTPSFTYLMLP